MDNRIRHRKQNPNKYEKSSQSVAVTAVVVVLSIVLIALTIYLSPLGNLIKEHVVDPIAAFVHQNHNDEKIVDALKEQEKQPFTVTPLVETAKPTPQKMVLQVQETPFYLLQMGTFLDQKTAEERASQIYGMGAGGVVQKDGAVFRVFAAAYLDEDSLIQVQSQVRADGFEATPYITEKDTVTVTLEGEENAILHAKNAVDFLAKVPQELSRLSLSFDCNQVDSEELMNRLNDLIEKGEEILNGFEPVQNDSLTPILSIIEKYCSSISTFYEEHDNISVNEISGALKRLQITTIIDYIRFFDQK